MRAAGESSIPRGQLASSHPSQGSCNELTPLVCSLGAIAPGASASIRVGVRAIGTPVMTNLAVVGSGELESTLHDNIAAATVRVRNTADAWSFTGRRLPRFIGSGRGEERGRESRLTG